MDDDDFNDEVQNTNIQSSQSQVNQTQPEVQTMYKDIFGDSDEEVEDDLPLNKSSNRSKLNTGDDDAKIFDDSDEDVFVSKGGRLQKKNTSSTNIPQSKVTLENLIDSDDEIEPLSSKQKDKDAANRKRKRKEKRERREKKNVGKTITSDQQNDGAKGDSGDEYDSGEEVQATREDEQFIDSEDDDNNKDILREYDQDNDRFDDERPMMMKKSSYSKKSSSGGGSGGDSSYRNRDPSLLDPLSQALVDMKKPKTQDLTDSEKDRFADRLLTKMSLAVEQDDILFRSGKPAVNKLRLLPSVQQATSMKQLQQVLLDKDILGVLRDWIEPRDSKTLPLLTIRSAVYDMLLKLPCSSDHLKRVVNDKPPIGAAIVALRKHKAETAENKRILKEIMEKWSRPIFSKSVDVRRGGGPSLSMMNQGENSEIQQALREKYIDANRVLKDNQDNSSQRVSLDAAITGSQQMKKTNNERVKVAYSTGFIFTVQPEQKNIVKEDIWEKKLGGGGRMSLLKKIKDTKSNKSGTGVKTNPRAMDLKIGGSTKH